MLEWNMRFLCPAIELDQIIVIENNVKGFTFAYDLRFVCLQKMLYNMCVYACSPLSLLVDFNNILCILRVLKYDLTVKDD